MTDEIYKHCMMCQTVNYHGKIYSTQQFIEQIRKPITTGICQQDDCKNAYALYASNGNLNLAKKIRQDLEK